jgi:hypothetical protein
MYPDLIACHTPYPLQANLSTPGDSTISQDNNLRKPWVKMTISYELTADVLTQDEIHSSIEDPALIEPIQQEA